MADSKEPRLVAEARLPGGPSPRWRATVWSAPTLGFPEGGGSVA
jgi:hypothetical protein